MGYITNVQRYRETYIKKFEDALQGRTLYFFGAGQCCARILPEFPYKDRVKAVFDNDEKKCGKKIAGVPILHAGCLEQIDLSASVFVAASLYYNEISAQLKKMGAAHCFCYHLLGFEDPTLQDIVALHGSDILHSDYFQIGGGDLAQIHALREMLADDASREILDAIIDRRRGRFLYYGDLYENDQYFPKNILTFKQDEVIVDGGAYDGDTIRSYQKHVGSYQRIYAFEPDSENFQALRRAFQNDGRVDCFNAGLWDRETELKFSGLASASSALSEDGGQSIAVKAIDGCALMPVTFVKMDIEGAELMALKGAQALLRRDKPKLAISIYHRRSDLWEIPLYIKRLVPEYQLFIRHHGLTLFETVLYAVAR